VCSSPCWNTGTRFHWPRSSKALGKVSPESQLTDSHPCTNSEHASPPSPCFSKSASPNIRSGQEESIFLPGGESSWQAVPRGAISQWWHNCRTQPVQLSLSLVLGGSVSLQQQAALCPPQLHPWRKAGGRRERKNLRGASVSAERASTALPCCTATCGQAAGRAISRAHSLGSPRYLR